jgi:catalase-peroxidase
MKDKSTFRGNHQNEAAGEGRQNSDWWPNQLKLNILRQHSKDSNPMSENFSYSEEFKKLDQENLKKDMIKLMRDSQDWWPADYGHYGPFFIRLSWHAAGTYRAGDGRGGAGTGNQRFAPLNSWPDNGNLDKARLLLWPLKKKYGNKVSWADLFVFAGNCALDSMGLKTAGFAFGREDIWHPEEDIYWGSETKWETNDQRYKGSRELENPLGAAVMGLIYVNPQGPNNVPDPAKAALDIRETFGRMAMNDEETVALIAGGHTFGKCHGAGPAKHVGVEPEGGKIADQGQGWLSSYKSGVAGDAITSGLEGAWTENPTVWDNNYFENLFNYEWELTKSPAGAHQWTPKEGAGDGTVVDAHDPNKKNAPMMATTDLALKVDSIYEKISRRFFENPKDLATAFSNAWFKLLHRDMGPSARYLGDMVPKKEFLWQDPIPKATYDSVDEADLYLLKEAMLESLSISSLVSTAWASASTYRDSDKRGGANGARIRLEPQINWEVNSSKEIKNTLSELENIQKEFNSTSEKRKVSMADLIVLGGCAGIEKASGREVPFTPGRTDASQKDTDLESFSFLNPLADGFRNYLSSDLNENFKISAEELLIDKANLLSLTAPEMTVLVGGLRVLDTNYDHSSLGVFTDSKEKLTNDFFRNLIDMSTKWRETSDQQDKFSGTVRKTDETKWEGSRVDLIFGSNSELRALSEVYATDDGNDKFTEDFIKAWDKVMNLDRF